MQTSLEIELFSFARSFTLSKRYGNKQKPGLGWFHPTVRANEGKALEAMQREIDKRIGD